jgi:glucose-6-phosphate isomerase
VQYPIHSEGISEDFRFAGIALDMKYQGIGEDEWSILYERSKEVGIISQIEAMFSGELLNTTELRPVLHTALRNISGSAILLDGKDIMPDVRAVWDRIQALCDEWIGVTDLIHIGIGGSVFGPDLVTKALENLPQSKSRGMRIHFAANVDSEELAGIFKKANPVSTKVIIVSKTFSTAETMMNARAVIHWLEINGLSTLQIHHSLYAVTANVAKANAFGIAEKNIYPFWDWVGGRFSVWSAVGLCIALQYGFDTYMEFLEGAHVVDEDFRNKPVESNLPILMALALIYQQEKGNSNGYAVIPYANALSQFPLWLQQLEMESHGKRAGRHGESIEYSSPIVFGSVGCNAQHSYFQLLHQGKQTIPVDFILVSTPMSNLPEAQEHHRFLMANCLAQAQALYSGKNSKIPNEVYPGQRPSNLIILQKLDAFHLGALLALYESRTIALGILWGINSFDQPGVELGKSLSIPIDLALKDHTRIDIDSIDSITHARIDFLNRDFINRNIEHSLQSIWVDDLI